MVLTLAVFDLDIIRLGSVFVDILQPHRVDDFVAAIGIVIIGFSIDHRREKRQLELQSLIQVNRIAVLKATMRTVQDLVNNFLNNMQLVQLEAGDALSPETTMMLENIIRETSAKLTELADLDCVPETEMAIGGGIAELSLK